MEADLETQDLWLELTNAYKKRIEALLQMQLCEYELLNLKLAQWKQNPGDTWLTMTDYEPWQSALKSLEVAQRELDLHISTRVE